MARWDAEWHRRLDLELANIPFYTDLEAAEVRRAMASDPVAFAVIYLGHHLKDKDSGEMTFSEIHYEWCRMAEGWKTPATEPQQGRVAVVGPRESGKSTWWFLILPLWAAVNGHSRFAAAFAHSSGQAEGHLATMKTELETNALLNADYPLLCEPARRRTGATVADRMGLLRTKSGFVFAARGIDSATLGLKVDDVRPDLLILDDVEPDEASYSPLLAEKRLGTITDAIFPLNIRARVVLVGTVTMPGSIMHQVVKAAHGTEVANWIRDEKIDARHYDAILTNDDGTERSIWEAKWPLSWLQSIRHTRSYAKNYANDPMAREGVYWLREDFRYGSLPSITRMALFVDPAVTSKKTSDFTGLALLGYRPAAPLKRVGNRLENRSEYEARVPLENRHSRVEIIHAEGVRLTGQHLRKHVIRILSRFPRTRKVVVEVNQGGELWLDVFAELPGVKVETHTASKSKEDRFADALEYWQRGRVLHSQKIPTLEEQAVAFPKAPHDDVIDAAAAGVLYFLKPEKRVQAGVRSSSYVGRTA